MLANVVLIIAHKDTNGHCISIAIDDFTKEAAAKAEICRQRGVGSVGELSNQTFHQIHL